jgi:hypothetical protein
VSQLLSHPNRDKLDDRNCLCPGQSQSGTDPFEGFVHCVDLVRAKERRDGM